MLEIIFGTYGTDKKFNDITQKLRELIKNNILYISRFSNLNLIFGDPTPGKYKEVSIKYRCDNRIREITVKENKNYLEYSINLCYLSSNINNILDKNTFLKDRYEVEFIVYQIILSKNILIFGLNSDSNIWSQVSNNIYYVEDNPKNIQKYGSGKSIIKVNYNTRNKNYLDYTNTPEQLLIKEIPNLDWNLIIIDGPPGFSGNTKGRMSPIYTSSIISNRNTKIIMNDIFRNTETIYSEKYLRKKFLVRMNIGRLIGFFFNKDT